MVPQDAAYVGAIPSVSPKVAYEPPVFKTFQDRKREKEQARLVESGSSSSISRSIPQSPIQPTYNNDSAPSTPQRQSFNVHSPPHPHPLPFQSPGRSTQSPSRPLPNPMAMSSPPPMSSRFAAVSRSDTVSSVRSLDRDAFPSPTRRPLPQPPVGVNSSKSLDRGIPGGLRGSPRVKTERRQPSVVQEENEDIMSDQSVSKPTTPIITTTSPIPQIVEPAPNVNGDSPSIDIPSINIDFGETNIPSINVPGINLPDDPQPEPENNVPSISFNFGDSNIPSINLPDDTSEDPTTADQGSGIVLAGLPVIAVSSGHSDETSAGPSNTSTLSRIVPTQAIICAGCHQPIIGRIVNAMEQRFHPQCFTCNQCGELLEHVSSYEWEGKAYCHLDYHDKFAHRCHHCKTPIVDSRFVTLNDANLGERFYHELHFFCSECGDPFLDPSKSSAPGTEHTGQDDDNETNPFVVHKGHPYCERCHLRLHKPRCKACQQPIPDVVVTALGSKWHQKCFVCAECGCQFANNMYFAKDARALCVSCYEENKR